MWRSCRLSRCGRMFPSLRLTTVSFPLGPSNPLLTSFYTSFRPLLTTNCSLCLVQSRCKGIEACHQVHACFLKTSLERINVVLLCGQMLVDLLEMTVKIVHLGFDSRET